MQMSPMSVPRSLFYLGALGGCLYAVCGWTGPNSVTRSVERFIPANNSWETMGTMPMGLHEHAGKHLRPSYQCLFIYWHQQVMASKTWQSKLTNHWAGKAEILPCISLINHEILNHSIKYPHAEKATHPDPGHKYCTCGGFTYSIEVYHCKNITALLFSRI